MDRRPLLQMILALSVVTLGGALVIGLSGYSQPYVVRVVDTSGDGDGAVIGFAQRTVSCPGPLRGTDDLGPLVPTDGEVVWPPPDPSPEPCRHDRGERQAGTILALGLAVVAGTTALVLLRRLGPAPALDPAPADPVTPEVLTR